MKSITRFFNVIPEETLQKARESYSRQNIYMQIGDQMDRILNDH